MQVVGQSGNAALTGQNAGEISPHFTAVGSSKLLVTGHYEGMRYYYY
jgi:hypothetical protein